MADAAEPTTAVGSLERTAFARAVDFARLRACGSLALTDSRGSDLADGGRRVGREVRPIPTREQAASSPRRFVLAWNDQCTPTRTEGVQFRTLAPAALQTFAIVLGVCWRDSSSDPYPGSTTSVDGVLERAVGVGMHDFTVKGALRHDLADARLVEITPEGEVRLGEAVAAWPSSEVDALRREHYRLATPGDGRSA